MSRFDYAFQNMHDSNAEFQRLVRESPYTRAEIAELLGKSVPTINAYMSTRNAKKRRRVDPAMIKALRNVLIQQESAVEAARKEAGLT